MDSYEPLYATEPPAAPEPAAAPEAADSPEAADAFRLSDLPELPDTVALNASLDGVSFTTNPPPVPARKQVVRTVPPPFVARVLAKLIDGAAAGVLYTLCTVLVADWLWGFLLGGVAASLYFLVCDGLDVDFMPRRSLGKKVMGLTVTRLDGQPMTAWTSAQRNWMFGVLYFVQAFTFDAPAVSVVLLLGALGLIGYEVYWVFVNPEGVRWGDDLAGTEVRQRVTEAVEVGVARDEAREYVAASPPSAAPPAHGRRLPPR